MKVILKKDTSKDSYTYYPSCAIHHPNSIVFNIVSFGYEDLGSHYYLKRSEFYGNMMTFVLGGSGFFSYRGKSYELKKNDVILINCMDEHEMRPNKGGMKIFFIHAESNIIEGFANHMEKNRGCVFNIKDERAFNDCVHTFLHMHENFDQFEASKAIYNALTMIRKETFLVDDALSSCPETVTKATIFIKENYQKINLSLEEISSYVGVSKFYLEKLFKKYLKNTVHSYLNYTRCLNSRNPILETEQSIESIAVSCGFSDSQSLIRYFKLHFNETPYQFRKRRSMAN